MRIRVLEGASDEYSAAADYYEGQEAGLGQQFLEDVDRAVANAVEFPHAGSPLESPKPELEVRAVLLSTFSYRLIFAVSASEFVIVAIMHTSRRPDYWRTRLDGLE